MENNQQQKQLVSVLICAYYSENFIEDTVNSIRNQDYKNIEILILDNNSKDKTNEILNDLSLKDSRIKIFKSDYNLGAYGGLNYLLEKARGEYYAIQDHDDLWHSQKLSKQIDFLSNNLDFIGCGTGCFGFFENDHKFNYGKRPQIDYYGWHPSIVFRKTNKRYDLNVTSYTDYHFVRYILCENKKLIYNFSEPYSLHRIRKDSKNLGTKWLNLLNIFEAMKSDNRSFLDKIWLIYASIIPNKIVNYLSVHIISPKKYYNINELKDSEIGKEYLKYIIKNN